MHVFLIEDHQSDVFFFQEALRERRDNVTLSVCSRGDLVVPQLGEMRSSGGLPDLIVLDLNLPRIHGLEVISLIRSDLPLSSIPIVVFSSSAADADIRSCYQRGANAYIVKPMDFEVLKEVVDSMILFWRRVEIRGVQR